MQRLTCLGVQLHAKVPLHEAGGGFLKLQDSIVRISAILGLIDFACHLLTDTRRCHRIIFADTKVNQLAVRVVG